MKQTLKKLWPLFLLIGAGCAQTPGGPPTQTVESPKQATVAPPTKTIVPPKESVTLPKKTIEVPKETAVTPKETTVSPQESVAIPKETIESPKQTTVTTPKQTAELPKKAPVRKSQAMRPEERHIWLPPSSEELEARRQRQKRLDVVAADLERLFMRYADILGNEIILENLIRGKESELRQLEARTGKQDSKEEERIKRLKKVLQEIEGSVKEMDASLEEIQKENADQKVQPKVQPKSWKDDYRHAILLFRDGQYRKSIAKFKSLLKKKYPRSLEDNILFGLASNYYKLKKYDQALVNLNNIILNHPKGDKWLVSHAISGLVYNLQGNPGKAIPVLESALRHQPNPELLKIINRLLKWANESATDASS